MTYSEIARSSPHKIDRYSHTTIVEHTVISRTDEDFLPLLTSQECFKKYVAPHLPSHNHLPTTRPEEVEI